MRPMRSGQMFGRGGVFTFDSVSAKLTIGIAVVSILAQLFDVVAANALLFPIEVTHAFKLWQPITYAFVLPIGDSPFMFVIGLFALWSIGTFLEFTWGTKRFLYFAVGTTVVAGILTVLLSMVWTATAAMPHFGATVMFTSTWVAYGLLVGRGQTSFWFLPVNGYALAGIGVALVGLDAIRYRSIVPVIPEIFGLLLTFGILQLGTPRTLWLKLKHWRYQRDLKNRAKHLNVVSGSRNGSRGSDRYLQ